MIAGMVRAAGGAREALQRGKGRLRRSRLAFMVSDDDRDRWVVGGPAVSDRVPTEGGHRTPAVALHGELTNLDTLRRQAGSTGGRPEDVIADLYRQNGIAVLEAMRGSFALAIVDRATCQVHVASDAFGTFPVYWQPVQGGLSFASELGAVIAAADDRPALSMQALADYVALGFVLGTKTLAASIRLLEPGTVLSVDWTTGDVSQRRYFAPVHLFQHGRPNRRDYPSLVCHAFRTAVARTTHDTVGLGLSLSGGLDSRAILSAVNGTSQTLRTYTVGVPGCADQTIATRLSRIAGTQHMFYGLTDRYLGEFVPSHGRLVELTDGMYLSHGLTEMLVVAFLRDSGISVLLRGHGGELAKTALAWPFHTDGHVSRMTDAAQLVPYLATRANYVSPGLNLSDLFAPAAAAAAGEGVAGSIRRVLDGVHLTPLELCSYLYLTELHTRLTVPSLELLRTAVTVRLPFMDRDFLEVLLAAPPEWRQDTSLHRTITRAGDPALLRVRNSNTGVRGDANPLVEAAFDKVNTVLRRLNVVGFRHYHAFDSWLRTQLLGAVERELTHHDTRIAALMQPGLLPRLVSEARQGRRDHGYLLQVLLNVEFWMRQHDIGEYAE